jgi:hypothetical protein
VIRLRGDSPLISWTGRSLVEMVEETQPSDQVKMRQSITDQMDRTRAGRHDGGDTAQ